MAIQCPHCGHRMNLRDAKPGKYQPKCGKCSQRFSLRIADDGAEPVVAKVEPAASKPVASPSPTNLDTASPASVAEDPGATLDHSASPVATPPMPQAAASSRMAPEPDATGEWTEQTKPDRIDATIEHVSKPSPDASRGGEKTAAAMDATLAHAPSSAPTATRGHSGVADRLGGYRIIRELGRGAMGTVYLARQLSLDRNVALKTVQTTWTNHPHVMARFTREAYAAAQLTHHNVVQIYDLGEDRGTPYFSMEFVKGESLSDLLERERKVDPRIAVGHILQAARGLRFAHQHGMVHRDVKPANLMLDEHGIVKVADLGLVKTPEVLDLNDESESSSSEVSSLAASTANVTMMNSAMGTPAYMAPEQAENAAGVDHRADIYSLGCTLYALLAGRPPFDGATAMEVITKQKMQPVPRIETIDPQVPGDLAEIVMRMVAKKPDERFASLDEVIEQLERFLHGSDTKRLPNDEHLRELESAVAEFRSSSAARLRSLLALSFVGGCLGCFVIALPFSLNVATGFLVMLVAGVLAYFVLTGVRDGTYLFDKTRELVFACRWSDWASWGLGGLLLLVGAFALGWLWIWLAMGIVGVLLASGFHFAIDGMVRRQQKPAMAKVETMLKNLRLRGVDEAQLRQFVAEFGGDHWEGFFEALFGYEAKLAARESLPVGKRRKRFRAWRDPLIRRIDARVRAHREAKDRAHLEKVEQANLRAKGIDATAAKKQAEQLAAALVDQAAESRRVAATNASAASAVDPKVAAAQKRARIKAMLAEARSGKYSKANSTPWLARGPLGLAFSGKVRFLLGCLLLTGCVMWVKQNKMVSAESVTTAAKEAIQERSVAGVADSVPRDAAATAEPLSLPLIGSFFDSFNPGVAGLMLIVMAMFRGWNMSLFALPAAAVIVLGPSLGLPGIQALGGSYTTSIVIGLAIGGVGLLLGRTKSESGE